MANYITFTDTFEREDGDVDAGNEDWERFDGYEPLTISGGELKGTKPSGSNHRRSAVSESNLGRGQVCTVKITELPSSGENFSPNIHMGTDGSRYELTLNNDSYGLWKRGKDGSQGWMDDKYPVTYTMEVGQEWSIGSEPSDQGESVFVTVSTVPGFPIDGIADTELTDGRCGVNQYAPNGGSGALDDLTVGIIRDGMTVVSVNGGSAITSNSGDITIVGTDLDIVDPAQIIIGDGVGANDLYLTVTSQSYTTIICNGFDIHDTAFSPESSLVLYIQEVAGGDDQTTSLPVSLLVEDGHQYVVATSISTSPPGLLDTTTTNAAAVGDIYEGPTTIDGQNTVIRSDGPHSNTNPAPNNGSLSSGWHYSASGQEWEEIAETWNLAGGAQAPVWNAIPNPTPCIVGVPYDYNIGALVSGQRPMTLTSVGDPLPAGLSIVSGAGEEQNERIEGTPTEAGEFTGIIVEADNGI